MKFSTPKAVHDGTTYRRAKMPEWLRGSMEDGFKHGSHVIPWRPHVTFPRVRTMKNERSLTRQADALSFESVFDYRSAFSFSYLPKTGCNANYEGTNGEGLGGMEKVLRTVIFTIGFFLLLPLSPIVLWLCVHSLPQWERVAIFRLGKLTISLVMESL